MRERIRAAGTSVSRSKVTLLMLRFQRRNGRKLLKVVRVLATLDEHAGAVRAPARAGGRRRTRLTAV